MRVIDAEGKALLYGEGNGAAVQITHAEWRNGDLAKLLLAQLTADERTSMFSASVDNSVEGQTIDFSQSLAMCVERNRTRSPRPSAIAMRQSSPRQARNCSASSRISPMPRRT